MEIDIATNQTFFDWSPLKATVSLDLSKYLIDLDGTNYGVNQSNWWDWFHKNSIQPVGDKYLVNSRHCCSSFFVDKEEVLSESLEVLMAATLRYHQTTFL